MIELKTTDLRDNFKKISELASSGEKILISRPHNKNLVLLSEKEYNELEKARRNAEYLAKLDQSWNEVSQGKVVTKMLDELEGLAR